MNGQLDKLYGDNNNQEKALLKGILLGEKKEITEEQEEAFRVSSLSHILAVSGMHIVYIIAGVVFILRIFGIAKPKIHIITVLVIIFFMFLTEFTPSVVRASIMSILVLLAFLLKRKSDVWINISISSLIILISNPYILLSLGYQLSYLATIGIILGMKIVGAYKEKKNYIENEIETKLEKKRVQKNIKGNVKNLLIDRLKVIKRFFIDTVIVCLSAQLFVFPIILLNFNTLSIYFLLSNLIVAPIMGLITILGFIVIFISYVFYPVAFYLNFIEILSLKFINIMTNFITNLPNSNIYLKTPYVISIIIYFAIILIFVGVYLSKERVVKRKIKKYSEHLIKILKIFLVVYLIIILVIDSNVFNKNNIKIYFVDVGQGDCTLIITEKNKKILIDGGGSSNENYDVGKNTTLPYLLDRRISKLDYVIISHFDADHVQGLFAVLDNIKVKNVIISKQKENNDNYEKFLRIVKEKNIKITVVKAGDKIILDKVTCMNILWPTKDLEVLDNPLNNNSIVAKLVYREFSMLFTGDIEEKAENAILKQYSANLSTLQATILKVAHHGSKTSSSEQFLEAVKPKIAIIGVGKNNTFGHPADIVLERFNIRGIKICRTDEEGEIVINSNGKDVQSGVKFVIERI